MNNSDNKKKLIRAISAFAFAVTVFASGSGHGNIIAYAEDAGYSLHSVEGDETSQENADNQDSKNDDNKEIKSLAVDLGAAKDYNVFVKNNFHNIYADIGDGMGSIAVGGNAQIPGGESRYTVSAYYVSGMVNGNFSEGADNRAESSYIDFESEFENLKALSRNIADISKYEYSCEYNYIDVYSPETNEMVKVIAGVNGYSDSNGQKRIYKTNDGALTFEGYDDTVNVFTLTVDEYNTLLDNGTLHQVNFNVTDGSFVIVNIIGNGDINLRGDWTSYYAGQQEIINGASTASKVMFNIPGGNNVYIGGNVGAVFAPSSYVESCSYGGTHCEGQLICDTFNAEDGRGIQFGRNAFEDNVVITSYVTNDTSSPEDEGNADENNNPTEEDNNNPTEEDNNNPTEEDNNNPTEEDNNNPTEEDNNNPTEEENNNPTEEDNSNPTEEDNNNPTEEDNSNPTEGDNSNPTEEENNNPTEEDNNNPTEEDNNNPTEGDNNNPTEEDNNNPTEEDNNNPTEEDNNNPTEEDNNNPTEEDNNNPTEEDNSNPTEEDNSNPAEEDNNNPTEEENNNPTEEDNNNPAEGDNSNPTDENNSNPTYENNKPAGEDGNTPASGNNSSPDYVYDDVESFDDEETPLAETPVVNEASEATEVIKTFDDEDVPLSETPVVEETSEPDEAADPEESSYFDYEDVPLGDTPFAEESPKTGNAPVETSAYAAMTAFLAAMVAAKKRRESK